MAEVMVDSESSVVDLALEQIDLLRHAPKKARSFEEIEEMCRSVHGEFSRSPALKLLEAYNYMRVGCFEAALESSLAFIDYFAMQDSGRCAEWERRRNDRRFSTLKHGLVLLAKLHRVFGSYIVGSMLLTQALANANENHNVFALRLCILEESAYDLNALNSNMLNAFSRYDSNPQHVETLQKTFMARLNSYNHQTEIANLDETYNNLLSAGYGVKNARFKAIVQHFRIGIAFMRTINAAIRCESPEIIAKYSAVSLENEISTQWHSHSRYIRDGIQAVNSTIQLANGCTAIMPAEEDTHEVDPEYGTECTLVNSVNVAYSYAYKGKFVEALELIETLKDKFPIEANPMIAVHWRLAEKCIQFDYCFFKGQFDSAIQVLDELACFSPVEALFRQSLIDFVYNRFDKTRLEKFIKTLRKNIDPHLKIRCRIALGTLRTTTGKYNESVEDLERCVRSAQKRSLGYLEKAALRRLAYSYIRSDNLNKAEECLFEARTTLTDVNGYTIETFLFHMTSFELFKEKLKNSAIYNGDLNTLKNNALHEINHAIECLPSGSYPILEQRLFREATLFAKEVLNNDEMANSFAERYLSVKCERNVNFCLFVL